MERHYSVNFLAEDFAGNICENYIKELHFEHRFWTRMPMFFKGWTKPVQVVFVESDSMCALCLAHFLYNGLAVVVPERQQKSLNSMGISSVAIEISCKFRHPEFKT